MSPDLLSTPPVVRLTKSFTTPFRNVVAAARTCYSSKGIIEDSDVGEPERFSPLAKSIYEAGHHTNFQHAHFQFALENVSRQFIWSFLHSHPFYNSEQVSQRYVAVKPDTMTVPALSEPALGIYRQTAEIQFEAYQRLCELLRGPVESEFRKRFRPSPRMEKKHNATIRRKAQEIARYVLPVGTHSYLYHTISGITLFRYWRLANQADAPVETRLVVGEMIKRVLEWDPEYEITLEEPLASETLPEEEFYSERPEIRDGANAERFRGEFDQALEGRVSKLVSWTTGAEELVASAVREVLGLCREDLGDDEAIALALDPGKNQLLGESLNLSTVSKLSRALYHAHYTFRKKLSHAADSQDQRHRMTPASRPVLSAHFDDAPDYITPQLLEQNDEANALYRETMERTWEAIALLRKEGVDTEWLAYLLPNAVSIRFTESGDLLNLQHKHEMRLCYNAQEEIWRASLDEALQIRDVHPKLGRYLLPPCTLRAMSTTKPICPEGPRYCGVIVWKKDVAEYDRVI